MRFRPKPTPMRSSVQAFGPAMAATGERHSIRMLRPFRMDFKTLCFTARVDTTRRWASSFWTTPRREIPQILWIRFWSFSRIPIRRRLIWRSGIGRPSIGATRLRGRCGLKKPSGTVGHIQTEAGGLAPSPALCFSCPFVQDWPSRKTRATASCARPLLWGLGKLHGNDI